MSQGREAVTDARSSRRELSGVNQEFEIDSQLAPNDAVVALLRRAEPPRRIPRNPFRKPKHEFEGEVSPEGFRIRRARSMNNILVIGIISPNGTGSRISVLIRPSIPSVVLSVIIALIYLVKLLTSAPNGRSDWLYLFEFIAILLVTLILVAFGVALLGALGRKETRNTVPILEETFQGNAVFKQAVQESAREFRARNAFGGSVVEFARRFRVPVLWFTEALGLVAVVLGIVSLVLFFRPPKASVMGPEQVGPSFFVNGVAWIYVGVIIARDALGRLQSRGIDRR
jgi:hypothetical protein